MDLSPSEQGWLHRCCKCLVQPLVGSVCSSVHMKKGVATVHLIPILVLQQAESKLKFCSILCLLGSGDVVHRCRLCMSRTNMGCLLTHTPARAAPADIYHAAWPHACCFPCQLGLGRASGAGRWVSQRPPPPSSHPQTSQCCPTSSCSHVERSGLKAICEG